MIRLLGDRILVALPPVPEETTTESGLILARDPDILRTPTKGIVLQLGEKSNTCDLDEVRSDVHTWFVENIPTYLDRHRFDGIGDYVDRVLMGMRPAPFQVQVGDCVLFLPTAGELLTEGDVEYAVLREEDIIGVVEQKKEAA